MKDQERLARIDQKLSDFMQMYHEDRKLAKAYYSYVDALKLKVDRMERPIKWAGGLISVSAVGALTVAGEKAMKWVLLHAPFAARP